MASTVSLAKTRSVAMAALSGALVVSHSTLQSSASAAGSEASSGLGVTQSEDSAMWDC